MGSIRDLNGECNVHLLYSPSNLAEIYVYDTLKTKCGASTESIRNINTKGAFSEVLELANIPPILSNKWLFILDYSKVKSLIKEKKALFSADTSEFLINVKNYKEFKEVKDILDNVNDIYLSIIRYKDVEFLLSERISKVLVDFVAKSYSNDPEQVFKLKEELDNGEVFNDRKSITNVCGISTGSITSFAFNLLKEFPSTEKGAKMVYKKRIAVAHDLAEVYGFSTLRNFIASSVKDILDIKQLYMVGAIYDKISDIPDCFDEKKLSRYSYYLKIINQIPYERILRLYLSLKKSGVWRKDIDMLNFMYAYYEKGEL